MAKSERLRMKDWRNLYRFLGEGCELAADPLAWRRYVVEHLPSLFGGQMGQYGELVVTGTPFCDLFWVQPQVFLDFGWATDSDRKPFEAHLAGGRPEDGPHITPDLLETPIEDRSLGRSSRRGIVRCSSTNTSRSAIWTMDCSPIT